MHIVLIEDDKFFASRISKKLEKNLYKTKVFNDVKTFYKDKSCFDTDLFILDLNLGWESWFEIIKFIRENKKNNIPIIILSWYSNVDYKVYWLDLWADDYIQKPVIPDELLARIRSVMRRKTGDLDSSIIEYGNIIFDLKTRNVFVSWNQIFLVKKENQILELFLLNKWKLITKEEIIKKVWWSQDCMFITDNTINSTISKLRKKLWSSFNLITRVNEGYILENF